MINSINVNKLLKLIPNAKIIDIRDNNSFKKGSIPTSINIPYNYLELTPGKYINKDNTYYIYCEQGLTSKKLCLKLLNKGYNVINVIGGYLSYKSLKNY